MLYLTGASLLLKHFYKECIWKITTNENDIFLTFDDGPHPIATPFVLEQLDLYNAKATFFCIGKNVTSEPEIYNSILEKGHAVGNHTDNHLNGWKTDDNIYLNDIAAAKEKIQSNLYRPPYGKITKFQLSLLKGKMKTIMWTRLTGDFDNELSKDNCYLNAIKNPKPGNIIVFHDSEKAYNNLKYALPRTLEFFSEKGYQFKKISFPHHDVY
ncbi:polysaccharide deacetylase family protein [soil metagenome]